jgi:hypothetical protein
MAQGIFSLRHIAPSDYHMDVAETSYIRSITKTGLRAGRIPGRKEIMENKPVPFTLTAQNMYMTGLIKEKTLESDVVIPGIFE